ncbi:MAG TPA: hypothetical protein VH333_10360 [Pseudonocardiaceae bacterium]|nr:hypothetical protein [Pseudonocardiaceae bacterium]
MVIPIHQHNPFVQSFLFFPIPTAATIEDRDEQTNPNNPPTDQ